MKKDIIRDYATEAFRAYAIYKNTEIPPSQPLRDDIEAVEGTLEELSKVGKTYIVQAVKEVYFVQPNKELKRGELTERIRRHAIKSYSSERNIYSWLKEARTLFAKKRGLRVR